MFPWLGMADPTPGSPPPPRPHPKPNPNPKPRQTEQEPLEVVEDDRESVGHEIGAVLTVAGPWGLSALLHLGLILLAIFIVWSTISTVEEEQPIIPIAELSPDPGAPVTQRETERQSARTPTERSLTQKINTAKSQLQSKVETQNTMIGAVGASAAAKSNPFSNPLRSSAAFKATFFGTGGNARRIAYMIDISGSLIQTLPFVIEELKKSISRLKPEQQFAVIFYKGNERIIVPGPNNESMIAATSENKQHVMNWIDEKGVVVPAGSSSPMIALQSALRLNPSPQLLFLLSDNITGEGRYEVDQRFLLEAIERENRQATKINTYQYIEPDTLEEAGLEPTLKLIAERTGGIYKFVSMRELGIE